MIDETDLEIIDELKKNGRASFSNIAEKLGIATSTVTGRFQKLEEKGVITGFSPKIDYEKLGFELTAMIDIKAESSKIIETAENLESNTRVISFFEVTGDTDMIIVSRFLDRKDMNSFIKELQQEEGIESTETNVILTQPKLEDNMNLKKILEEDRDSLS
jgi:DNA-binding Lrp family transcriptional regulator